MSLSKVIERKDDFVGGVVEFNDPGCPRIRVRALITDARGSKNLTLVAWVVLERDRQHSETGWHAPLDVEEFEMSLRANDYCLTKDRRGRVRLDARRRGRVLNARLYAREQDYVVLIPADSSRLLTNRLQGC